MKKTLFLLLAIWLCAADPQPSLACTCLRDSRALSPKEFKELIAKELIGADAVFIGEVVDLNIFEVKFRVERVWNGPSQDEIILLGGGEIHEDAILLESSCDYHFEHRRKYLVYAYRSDRGLKTHYCSRTKRLEDAGADIKELNEISPVEIKSKNPDQ
jgi:hypothetical protein